MLPQEQRQLRIDELTREIEAMRLQIKQLQEEREHVQKMQGNAEDSSVAVSGSQKVIANVSKWTCNPLFGIVFNYVLTTGRRIMDKPIILESTKIKNQLTSFLHTFNVKLSGDSQNCPSIQSTVNPVVVCSMETQTYEAPGTVGKVPQPTMPMKSGEENNTAKKVVENYNKAKAALAYLEDVKLTFKNEPEICKLIVYNMFLANMREFEAGNLSHFDVMAKVKVLFSGQPHLLVRFNAFLPPSHQIDLKAVTVVPVSPIIASVDANPKQAVEAADKIVVIENNSNTKPVLTIPGTSVKAESQTEKKLVDCSEAYSYLTKVREEFHNEPNKLKCFRMILQAIEKRLRDKACHDVNNNDGAERVILQQITNLEE